MRIELCFLVQDHIDNMARKPKGMYGCKYFRITLAPISVEEIQKMSAASLMAAARKYFQHSEKNVQQGHINLTALEQLHRYEGNLQCLVVF